MRFIVLFSPPPYEGAPIDLPSEQVGLERVDQAREKAGVPKLSPTLVSGEIPAFRGYPQMEISEQVARDSGLFMKMNFITVRVPIRSMNEFTDIQSEVEMDPTTGGILTVWWERTVNEARILTAWQAAGFPQEWNPLAEE